MYLLRALPLVVAGILVAGCSSSDVTLDSAPTDANSAQALAEAVAEKADCGSLENYEEASDHWSFTCQSGNDTYEIWAVRDARAKLAVLTKIGLTPAVKGGAYFLVKSTPTSGRQFGSLDRFPGVIQKAAG